MQVERPASAKYPYKTPEELSREKEQVLNERVPPLVIDAASTEAVREMAEDLHDRLKGAVGLVFDLTEKVKKTNQEVGHSSNFHVLVCYIIVSSIQFNHKSKVKKVCNL